MKNNHVDISSGHALRKGNGLLPVEPTLRTELEQTPPENDGVIAQCEAAVNNTFGGFDPGVIQSSIRNMNVVSKGFFDYAIRAAAEKLSVQDFWTCNTPPQRAAFIEKYMRAELGL